MSVNGTKKTVQCPAPYAICADTAILATAPAPMLASGYADLLAKLPAGGDWLIADALGEDPITHREWDLIQKPLRGWLSDPHDFHRVFDGLANTGYSMQMKHDSRPASGAEHLFSHVWEMEGLSVNGEAVSHGFKVGIGTLASVRLMGFVLDTTAEQARKLARPIPTLEERQAEITELLRRGCYGGGVPETALGKFQTGAAGEERRNLIFERWGKIQTGIREQLLPEAEILRLLRAAGAPTEYAEIGLDRAQYLHGIRTAQLIRKRYTVIDLLYEVGLLETAIGSRL
jgi:glycerol-1-phosphate dehydrogenase [NAD(P)+]